MTISPPSAVLAAPAHLTHPLIVDSAGPEATALAASAGLILDPWQAHALEVGLAEQGDGRWAAREVGLVVPRQNGKGSILEALIVAALVLFDERLILYSAHEFKTAQETFLRVKSLIEANQDLAGRIAKIHSAHGSEGIELTTGQRLRFVARSKGSGRGFSPQRIILDEALNLSSKAVAALLFSMSAQDNPQLWYTSSAPDDTLDSAVLRRLMRRGRQGDTSLAYIEYSADAGSDPADEGTWAKANPGFPHRISPETIRTERGATDEADFLRERLGVVDISEHSSDRVIPADAWAACKDPKSGPVGRVAFALDVAPDRRNGAFGVVGQSGRGGIHGEIADYGTGTSWMVNRARELQAKWGGRLAVATGSPASSLVTDLELAGVEVLLVPVSDHAAACGALFDAITQFQFRHLGQPELDTAVDGADRRFYGDSWLWSRRTSTTDICPLVAVTLAKWAFDQGPAKPTLSVW